MWGTARQVRLSGLAPADGYTDPILALCLSGHHLCCIGPQNEPRILLPLFLVEHDLRQSTLERLVEFWEVSIRRCMCYSVSSTLGPVFNKDGFDMHRRRSRLAVVVMNSGF